ncbi:MAG: hypothetical protein AAB875_02065 [Patescibacteria group bacterium]
MARNEQLAKIVLGQMFDFLKNKDAMLIGEDRDSGSELILTLGRVDVDEEAKFRIIRGSVLGYGYDFKGEVEGESSRKMYERAVRNTKEYSGHPNFETFLDSGVVADRYGWYLTRV